MSRVLWRDAQGIEGTLDLPTDGEAFIGRAIDCAIRTEDAMVSRHHAKIVSRGGEHSVEDLGSSNGVFFQEQKVRHHRLRHGDAVRCGSLWFRFVDPPAERSKGGRRRPAPVPTVMPSDDYIPPPKPGAMKGSPEAGTSQAGPTEEEVQRLRRRLDQVQAELRHYRGGGEEALAVEALEDEIARLGEERDRYKAKVADLEAQLLAEGADAKVKRAGAIAQTASEIVSGLNDVLSNLRINVMAAEGEFEQYAGTIPRASFELIREALRSSATDMESARELLRKLRALAM